MILVFEVALKYTTGLLPNISNHKKAMMVLVGKNVFANFHSSMSYNPVGPEFKVNESTICIKYGEGAGNGTPLQYSCLENPMDGGAW